MNTPTPKKNTPSKRKSEPVGLLLILGLMLFPASSWAAEQCPQPRKTQAAPANIAGMPVPNNADKEAGKLIFNKTAKPLACKMCHGDAGKGDGKLGRALTPAPRNFACSVTMKNVSAGQMFWVIKNGSRGTGMVAHGRTLKDEDIWSVVKYIREDLMQ